MILQDFKPKQTALLGKTISVVIRWRRILQHTRLGQEASAQQHQRSQQQATNILPFATPSNKWPGERSRNSPQSRRGPERRCVVPKQPPKGREFVSSQNRHMIVFLLRVGCRFFNVSFMFEAEPGKSVSSIRLPGDQLIP